MFLKVKLRRIILIAKHSQCACIMLRSLAIDFLRNSFRKQQENKDLSQEQAHKCRKVIGNVCTCLLQSALYCIDKNKRRKKEDKDRKKSKKDNLISFCFPILPCCSLPLCGMERSAYFCTQKHAMESKSQKENINKTI
ncbi:hypothetical protein HMPREF2139_12715 [Prevotella denticola DNF00960]|nr:hypothetical protein HMPREF2139_12715 [Prevotella denticola DNF00960]